MNIIKVGLLGITGMMMAVQFKNEKSEYSLYICLGAGLLISFGILEQLSHLVGTIKRIGEYAELPELHLGILLKIMGMTYVSEFSSGMCKDAGYSHLSTQIEIYAKLMIFIMSAPILLKLMETIGDFLS